MRSASAKHWTPGVITAFIVWAIIGQSGVRNARAAEEPATNIDLMGLLTTDVVHQLYAKFSADIQGRTIRIEPVGSSEDYTFVANIFVRELLAAGVTTLAPGSSGSAAAPAKPAGAATSSSPPAGSTGGAPNTGNAALNLQERARGAQNTPQAPATTPSSPPAAGSGGANSTPEPTGPALVLKFRNVAFDLSYPDSYRSYLVGGKHFRRVATVRIQATLSDPDGRVLWTGEAQRSTSDEFANADATRIQQGTYAFAHPDTPSSGVGKFIEPVFVSGIIVGLIYLFFSNQSGS